MVADNFRVLVTGSRTWTGALRICTALGEVWKEHPHATLVTGACPKGADHLAEYWWTRWGGVTERWPADWDRHRKRAGFIRNEYMVSLGADLALAFIMPCANPKCRNREPHGSHGATHCAALAERAGIEVRRFTPDG